MYTTIRSRIQYTHREHSPLSHLRPTIGKVAKFTSSRRRTLVNALFHKSRTLPHSPMGFLQENATANIVIIIEEYNINNVFSPLSAFLFSKTGKECRFFTNFGTSKEHRMEEKHKMFHLQRISLFQFMKDVVKVRKLSG